MLVKIFDERGPGRRGHRRPEEACFNVRTILVLYNNRKLISFHSGSKFQMTFLILMQLFDHENFNILKHLNTLNQHQAYRL